MSLEEAEQKLGKLGLVTFKLTEPMLGIGSCIRNLNDQNHILDIITIRFVENSWRVLAYVGVGYGDIVSFETLAQAVDYVHNIYKPLALTTPLTIVQAIKILADQGLTAGYSGRAGISEIYGFAPLRIRVDGFLAAHSFIINQKLEGWLGIATIGHRVDFVASGNLETVVNELCDYFDTMSV